MKKEDFIIDREKEEFTHETAISLSEKVIEEMEEKGWDDFSIERFCTEFERRADRGIDFSRNQIPWKGGTWRGIVL